MDYSYTDGGWFGSASASSAYQLTNHDSA